MPLKNHEDGIYGYSRIIVLFEHYLCKCINVLDVCFSTFYIYIKKNEQKEMLISMYALTNTKHLEHYTY